MVAFTNPSSEEPSSSIHNFFHDTSASHFLNSMQRHNDTDMDGQQQVIVSAFLFIFACGLVTSLFVLFRYYWPAICAPCADLLDTCERGGDEHGSTYTPFDEYDEEKHKYILRDIKQEIATSYVAEKKPAVPEEKLSITRVNAPESAAPFY